MIELDNIILYRNDKTILNDVSWHVKQGEHWALLGLNGSGKTTLLKLLNCYIWPNEGSVKVLGETFGHTYIPELRTRIGWVSNAMVEQFHEQDNAVEIVLSGKYGALRLFQDVTDEEIRDAVNIMKHFNCDHLANKAFGLLSQGEKQRIQIARALLANPELLILDEPCSGLDLIERENLLETIEQIATIKQAPTLLYVTHHVEEILPCFSHILLLRDGEVFKQGKCSELLNEQVLTEFFQHQVTVQHEQERVWVAVKK